MTTYYKAVRVDGTDFYSGAVRWAPESGDIPAGFLVTHPTSTVWGRDHATHLCASTAATDCTGFRWPCRLLKVQPVGEIHEHDGCKVSALSWRVVRELPATQALGPQGAAVAALIEGVTRLDAESLARLADAYRDAVWFAGLDAAWDAARVAAWDAGRDAARDAAWVAAWRAARNADRDAAQDAARDAAVAVVAWDLISPEQQDTLTAPVRAALPDLWADVEHLLPQEVR